MGAVVADLSQKGGLPFRRLTFFEAEGKVYAISARYATRDAQRYRSLAVTYGQGSRDKKGRARWTSADGRVAVLSPGGGLQLIAVDQGVQAGVYTSAEAARLKARLHLTPKVAENRGIKLEDVRTEKIAPPPRVSAAVKLERVPDRLTVIKGLPAMVGIKVTNTGESPSAKVPLLFRYAEQDDGPSSEFTKDIAPVLSARQSTDVITTLVFPANAALGNHRVDVALGEQVLSVPVTIVAPGPDLVISAIKAPKSASAGASVPVEIVVWNLGNKPTSEGFSVFLFHLEGSSPADAAADSALATYKGPALAPQGHVKLTANLQMPTFHYGEVITLRGRVHSSEDAVRTNNNQRAEVTIAMPPNAEPSHDVELPVRIVVDNLECVDKGEIGSDEPYLYLTALHTARPDPQVSPKRAWEDIADNPWDYPWWTGLDDESRYGKIGSTLFGGESAVRFGEAIGFHLSLLEADEGWGGKPGWHLDPDDEIGFITPTFRFSDLYKNAGKTLTLADDIADEDGDGRYRVHYRVIVGQPQKATTPKSQFESVNWAAWAGAYELRIAGDTLVVTLTYEAPKDGSVDGRSHPHGTLRGTVKGKPGIVITTHRLWGNYWEFTLGKPKSPGRRLVGYLVGDAKQPSIAGTSWNDEIEAGFVMTRPGAAQ